MYSVYFIRSGTTNGNMRENIKKTLVSGSSHIRSVLIGVEYGNCCCRTLDVYFTFCYLYGASSIKADLKTCNLWTDWSVSYKSVI